MVFKNEAIYSDEEQKYKKKYNIDNRFGISCFDRDRDMFLARSGMGKERERSFLLFIGDEIYPIVASGYEFGKGNQEDGTEITNDILNIRIPDSFKNKFSMQQIKEILVEAITEANFRYPEGHPGRYKNIITKVNFSKYCK